MIRPSWCWCLPRATFESTQCAVPNRIACPPARPPLLLVSASLGVGLLCGRATRVNSGAKAIHTIGSPPSKRRAGELGSDDCAEAEAPRTTFDAGMV